MILPVCDAVAVEQAAKPAGSTRASWPTSERSRRLGAEPARGIAVEGRTCQRPMQAQSRVGAHDFPPAGSTGPAGGKNLVRTVRTRRPARTPALRCRVGLLTDRILPDLNFQYL
jgi:hypothetical protein